MLKKMLPIVAVLALSGCQNMSAADMATRVISGGAVAAQGLFISDADEVKIGQQTMAQVFAETPEFPNPEIRDYITQVGLKMVAQSDRKDLAYQFHVIQSNEVNAFAAPGGFVFVTTAALQLMKNEAQLAGVLGHEVGHVAKRHSVEGIKNEMVAQGIATAVLGQNSNQLIQAGANIASNLILKGFDRGAELESDRLGAAYAYGAGYDPRELGNFLDALRQVSGETPTWLVAASDHPLTDDRLTKLNEFISSQQMELSGRTTGADTYKAMVLDRLGAVSVPASPTPSATPAS